MKKKWLIGLLTLVMSLTLCFGLVACGNDDAEQAKSAIDVVKRLYQDDAPDTPGNYTVIGQTIVDGTVYPITWSVSSDTQNITDYVKIGTMDESTKLVTIGITKADDAIEYQLKATITVGKATESIEFTRKIPAKPKNAAGTEEDPYSVGKVMEIAEGIGETGKYYYSEADQGKDTPTRVWVEGYIVDCGNGSYFGTDAVGWVYIVDEYSEDKNSSSPDALCIYRIEYDDTNLTCFEDLAVGKKITVNGHIEWYQGKNDREPYAEIASFKKSDNTYSSVYCSYLEKAARTPEASIELALSKVAESMTITKTGDVELDASTIPNVTFAWESDNTSYPVEGGKLKVNALPETQTTVTLTVTATCDGKTGTKTVTVTIKPQAQVEENTALFDFSSVTEKGDALTDGDNLAFFEEYVTPNAGLTAATAEKVYRGNGTGGAYESTGGFLKFGTSKLNGKLTLTFEKTVSKVEVKCQSWTSSSGDKMTVNGGTAQSIPATSAEILTFNLATASKTVEIETAKRAFIFEITVTFGEGSGQTDPQDPEDQTVKVFNPIEEAPTAGKYYIGMYANNSWYYLTGEADATNNYRLLTTQDSDKAAEMTIETTTGGYLIKCGEKYLDIKKNGNYINSLYLDAHDESCVWVWNSQYHTLLVTVEGTEYFLGSYNTFYANMTANKKSFLEDETKAANQYPSRLGTFTTETKPAPDPQDPEDQHDDKTYGSATAPLSVASALDLAEKECVKNGDFTKQIVYMVGIVTNVPTDKGSYYQSITLRDEGQESKTILVYSISLDKDVAAPAQNDKLLIRGYITRYKYGDTEGATSDGVIEFATSKDGLYVYAQDNTRGTSTIQVEADGATVNGLPASALNGSEQTFTVSVNAGRKLDTVKVNGTLLTESNGSYKFTLAGNTTVKVETVGESEQVSTEVSALGFSVAEKSGDGKASSYTGSFEATRNDTTWTIEGFNNNNNADSWTFIKTGRKGNACVGKITTKTALSSTITKVIVTIDSSSKSYMADKVNAFKLEIATTEDFSDATTITKTIAVGENEFEIESPAANCFYRITIDCQAGSDNGFVVLSKVSYWGY